MRRIQKSLVLMVAIASFYAFAMLAVAGEPISPLSDSQVIEQFSRFDPVQLRAAIVDLQNDYGADYPEADSYLANLDSVASETPDCNLK